VRQLGRKMKTQNVSFLIQAAKWEALSAEAGFLDEMRERLIEKLGLGKRPLGVGDVLCFYYTDLVQVVERLIALDKAALRQEGIPEDTLQLTRDALKEHRALLAQLRLLSTRVLSPIVFSKS
jgi:hypothetical protein